MASGRKPLQGLSKAGSLFFATRAHGSFKKYKIMFNLRPLFEPILWFMKPYPIGGTLTDNIINYEVGGYNEYALKNSETLNSGLEICSNILKVKTESSDRGLHPTQKAVSLKAARFGQPFHFSSFLPLAIARWQLLCAR